MADSTITNLGASITALADTDKFVADDTSDGSDTSWVNWSTMRQQVTPFDVPVTVAVTDACALLVETATGAEVFKVDTSASKAYVNGREISEVLIAASRLDSAAACVVFSNIPQGYRNLRLVWKLRSTRSDSNLDGILFQLNQSGAASYFYIATSDVTGTPFTSASNNQPNGIFGNVSTSQGASRIYANGVATFEDYSASQPTNFNYQNQVYANPADTTTWRNQHGGGVFTIASAINRISIYSNSGSNWAASTTVQLYGVA